MNIWNSLCEKTVTIEAINEFKSYLENVLLNTESNFGGFTIPPKRIAISVTTIIIIILLHFVLCIAIIIGYQANASQATWNSVLITKIIFTWLAPLISKKPPQCTMSRNTNTNIKNITPILLIYSNNIILWAAVIVVLDVSWIQSCIRQCSSCSSLWLYPWAGSRLRIRWAGLFESMYSPMQVANSKHNVSKKTILSEKINS